MVAEAGSPCGPLRGGARRPGPFSPRQLKLDILTSRQSGAGGQSPGDFIRAQHRVISRVLSPSSLAALCRLVGLRFDAAPSDLTRAYRRETLSPRADENCRIRWIR